MNVQMSMGDSPLGALIYPHSVAAAASTPERLRLGLQTNEHVSSPLVFTGIFSPDECDCIIDLSSRRRPRVGTMMYAQPHIRHSSIAWIDLRDDSEWLYAKIWQTFLAVNRWFKFELSGLVDELQFARYGVSDRFGWHLDAGGGQTSTRKLSMSVQLSADTDYAGGELEFAACGPLDPRRRRGTVIVFPAFLAHQVTPVTHGTRHSLVAWAHGPAFR